MKMTNKGFTLIELMIAVAVVGILVMVAVPSYRTYIQKSRRSDGTSALLAIQSAEESYRYGNTTYGTFAQVWSSTSTNSPGAYYSLAVSNLSATTYTITATAKSSSGQTTDKEGSTLCNVLTLAVSNGATTKTPTVCW